MSFLCTALLPEQNIISVRDERTIREKKVPTSKRPNGFGNKLTFFLDACEMAYGLMALWPVTYDLLLRVEGHLFGYVKPIWSSKYRIYTRAGGIKHEKKAVPLQAKVTPKTEISYQVQNIVLVVVNTSRSIHVANSLTRGIDQTITLCEL